MPDLEEKSSKLQTFRKLVRQYCQLAGYSLKALAGETGMHQVTLSNKLNGDSKSLLTHNDVKLIITTLAGWGGLTDQGQVSELLQLAGMSESSFSPAEWAKAPLNQLDKVPYAFKAAPEPAIKKPRQAKPKEVEPAVLAEGGPALFTYPATQLPLPLTSLVGRRQELARAVNLLNRANVRLVTLTGPGGVGKTRLALQVSQALAADFEDGVYFVELAPVRDLALLTQTLAQSLNLHLTPYQNQSDQALAALKAHLQARRLLLVLDNFEQLVEAAGPVSDLVRSAPGLKVLVTSRVLLRLYGEHELVVPPLAVPATGIDPSLETLGQNEAVALFVQQAQAAQAGFRLNEQNASTVAQICRVLEGLPLALELASARLKVLTPQALLSRLQVRLPMLSGGSRDLPERHRSLRSTLEWSFELLSDGEKQLFRRLAVFPGSFGLDAAEAVLAETADQTLEIYEGLTSLLDKSLLQRVPDFADEPRYRMLEIIREYALEQLTQNGESGLIYERHLTYYLKLVEELEPSLLKNEQNAGVARLESEIDNLRAAFDYSLKAATPASAGFSPYLAGLRLAVALDNFWRWKGYFNEAQTWTALLLSKAEQQPAELKASPGYQRTLCELLIDRAAHFENFNDYGQATGHAEQALAIARELADKRLQAMALQQIAFARMGQGQSQEAIELLTQSREFFLAENHLVGLADTTANLGLLADRSGNYSLAEYWFEKGLALARELENRHLLLTLFNNLGYLKNKQGRYKKAQTMLEEALAIARDIKSEQNLEYLLNNLARVNISLGQYDPAEALLKENLDRNKFTSNLTYAYTLGCLGLVAKSAGNYAVASGYTRQALDLFRKVNIPFHIIEMLIQTGELEVMVGNYAAARPYLAEALGLARQKEPGLPLSRALYGLCYLEFKLGNFAEAAKFCQEGLLLCQAEPDAIELGQGLAWEVIIQNRIDGPESSQPKVERIAALLAASGGVLEPHQAAEYQKVATALK